MGLRNAYLAAVDRPHACGCGAAGAPCGRCNPSSWDEPPRLPKGFEPGERSLMKYANLPPRTNLTAFKRGDRVKLSEWGKSRSHVRAEFGTVTSVLKSGRSIWVLFDGNKRPTPVHKSYIESA